MPLRAEGMTVVFTVWSVADDSPATGEAANLNIYIIKDGASAVAADGTPAEVDATNAPGEYRLVLTDGSSGEMDAETVTVCGTCDTVDVVVIPLHIQTDAYPVAADILTQAAAALVAVHLDHLLAVDTGASLPGAAGALFQDLVEDDGGAWRFNANALEEAPSGTGGDASAANQTSMLANLASILEDIVDMKGTGFVKDTNSLVNLLTSAGYEGSGGTGANAFTYTLTDPLTEVPIAGATVHVSDQLDGSDPIAVQITDASGEVLFHLDDGTYYFFSYHPTYAPINPDTETVP